MRNLSLGTLALLGSLLLVTAADAHPRLKLAGPAPGSTVQVSPKTIRIQFSEGIELSFSGIELKNQKGEVQPTGEASVDPKSKALLVVPVTGTLAPGLYTVSWHAVGDDTHKQEGHYDFTVKP